MKYASCGTYRGFWFTNENIKEKTGRTIKSITIYLNPVSGNDANSGLDSSRPKRTLQAAFDILPKSN